MIKTQKSAVKIRVFVNLYVQDTTNPDRDFMIKYLSKALRCLTSLDEVCEYCTEDFARILYQIKVNDERAFPVETLQKEKFLEMVYFYKGLKIL